MDWKAANEQQDEARWRVFLMFVAMVVLVIRTGLVSRGVLLPPESAPASRRTGGRPSTVPDVAHRASPEDACAAVPCRSGGVSRYIERARHLGADESADLWPFASELPRIAARLCERLVQRLDSS